MTIEQTVEITEERQLHLILPPGIPVGTAATVNIFIPTEGTSPAVKKNAHRSVDEISGKLWELCKDSSLTSDSFLEMRRKDKELEETQYRRMFHN
jgi:hypothetical protein